MRIGAIKPSGATSFKQTSLGVLSRTQLLPLELEGTKRGLEYIYTFIKSNQNGEITQNLFVKFMRFRLNGFSQNGLDCIEPPR